MTPTSQKLHPAGEEQPAGYQSSSPPVRLKRERGMDKTLEDSYPASDPPSSIPDPMLEDEPTADQAA
jgi:hypothetical protein